MMIDEALSNFAFNFNLRHYALDGYTAATFGTVQQSAFAAGMVGFSRYSPPHQPTHTERERDASACISRHPAFALAPVYRPMHLKRAFELSRGPGRKPGASLYTRKRLSSLFLSRI